MHRPKIHWANDPPSPISRLKQGAQATPYEIDMNSGSGVLIQERRLVQSALLVRPTTGGAGVTWISLYAGVTVVAAIAVFLLAERLQAPGDPGPGNLVRYTLVAVAALLWPLMVLGLAQVGLIAMVRSRPRPSAGADSGRLRTGLSGMNFGGVSADRGDWQPTNAGFA
jgi:hypothetical protein